MGSVHTDASGDDGYPSIVHSMRLVVASQGIQDSENTIALLVNVICLVHKFNSVGRVWVGTSHASICSQYCIDDPVHNHNWSGCCIHVVLYRISAGRTNYSDLVPLECLSRSFVCNSSYQNWY